MYGDDVVHNTSCLLYQSGAVTVPLRFRNGSATVRFPNFPIFSFPILNVNLVGGLVAIFYFPINIGLLIIPIDELIFFRGVAQPPTRNWNCIFSIFPVMGPAPLPYFFLGGNLKLHVWPNSCEHVLAGKHCMSFGFSRQNSFYYPPPLFCAHVTNAVD